jgi:Fic family protein
MRSFQSTYTLDPVPGDVVALLRRIDRAAGAEGQHRDQLPQLLSALRDQARVESVTASSAIEGVVVKSSRVAKLTSTSPGALRNRSEAEFAGYTNALDYLSQQEPRDLNIGLVLHLHRLLFGLGDMARGSFKSSDNLVVDVLRNGSRQVRFQPVSATATPFYVEELITRTLAALENTAVHPLIVVAAFALDLLCIHPFEDGNGRVTRLLTTHLAGQAGYDVGRYISLEQLIFDTKDEYYSQLRASTEGWFEDGQHDPWPWIRYLLGRIADAYGQFEERIASSTSSGFKQDRVRAFILTHSSQTFAISDVRRALPGVSDNTIRIVLSELKSKGRISVDGSGRSATWRRTESSSVGFS